MKSSMTISLNFPFIPPRKPSKKTIAFLIAASLLVKEFTNLIKIVGQLFIKVFLGILVGSIVRPVPPVTSAISYVWIEDAREELCKLESRALKERDPEERRRVLDILNGMEVT